MYYCTSLKACLVSSDAIYTVAYGRPHLAIVKSTVTAEKVELKRNAHSDLVIIMEFQSQITENSESKKQSSVLNLFALKITTLF